MKKMVSEMSKEEILSALLEDGFEFNSFHAVDVAETIQLAARSGTLSWTDQHVISTLINRPLNLQPGWNDL